MVSGKNTTVIDAIATLYSANVCFVDGDTDAGNRKLDHASKLILAAKRATEPAGEDITLADTPAAVAACAVEDCLCDLIVKVEGMSMASVGSPMYHALVRARAALQTLAPEKFAMLNKTQAHVGG